MYNDLSCLKASKIYRQPKATNCLQWRNALINELIQ